MALLGQTVGGYEVTEKIAEGGMGVIYGARHSLMGRAAVVKVLLPQMCAQKSVVERFFNEARAAAQIHHPGIVDIFDLGYLPDGQAYIVMERLRGETLKERIGRGRVPWHSAVFMVRQMAGALGAAHKEGIVHRDLKPDNIFVVPDPDIPGGERVKILDFGIAKLATVQGSMATLAGSIMGTPPYMAPEQCVDSAAVDHRTDLYALGCILYEMLTQSPPFGHGQLDVLAAHMRDPVPPLRTWEPTVPDWLEAVGLRLLAKDPITRFQSCDELATELTLRLPSAGTSPPVGTPYPMSQGPAVTPYPMPHSPTAPSQGNVAAPSITTHNAGAAQVVVAGEENKGGKAGIIALLVVLALVAGGGAYLAIGGGDSDKRAANDDPPAAVVDAAVAKPTSVVDAAVRVVASSPDAAVPAATADAAVKIVNANKVDDAGAPRPDDAEARKAALAAKARADYLKNAHKAAGGLAKAGLCNKVRRARDRAEKKYKGTAPSFAKTLELCKKRLDELLRKAKPRLTQAD